jgi:hypothetical protein
MYVRLDRVVGKVFLKSGSACFLWFYNFLCPCVVASSSSIQQQAIRRCRPFSWIRLVHLRNLYIYIYFFLIVQCSRSVLSSNLTSSRCRASSSSCRCAGNLCSLSPFVSIAENISLSHQSCQSIQQYLPAITHGNSSMHHTVPCKTSQLISATGAQAIRKIYSDTHTVYMQIVLHLKW